LNNPKTKVIKYSGHWTRSQVAKDVRSLYIFTDNLNRTSGVSPIDPESDYAKKYGIGKKYPGATSAVIRGLNNAMPITTQKKYVSGPQSALGNW
jgi:hypothetical protein